MFAMALDSLPEIRWDDVSPVLVALGKAVVLVVLVWLVYRLALRGLHVLETRKTLSPRVTLALRWPLRWVAVAVGILVVLEGFGVLRNAWALISTVMALVAIGFVAVWSVLSNVLCSVMLLIVQPFQIGDTIELCNQNVRGKVVNFNLLFTTLRGEADDLIQIPNNAFFQSPIRRQLGKSTVDLDQQLDEKEAAD